MSNTKTTVADLEATWIAARDAYDDSDLNYLEWVQTAPVDDLIADFEDYLNHPTFNKTHPLEPSRMNLYVRAKTFAVARDADVDTALIWKLSFGGAA